MKKELLMFAYAIATLGFMYVRPLSVQQAWQTVGVFTVFIVTTAFAISR